MVHIKKLIIENFKSFGGKTEIKFMDKLNLIIGPNGSGKSNISEAISFVLGRMSKKGLRTEKLSHLIFNGGKHGKAADSASVKLVFSNEDKIFPIEDDYVEIIRRINNDGQSEYRINGKKSTRTEIVNLVDYVGLSPEGFNMIMQGNIAKFVDMSSFERGQIIEKISGIATYEEKKDKAMKELEKVKEKIKETNILLKERQKHLDELKKEKKQAEKFQNTKEQLHIYKGRLLFKQLTDKKEEHEKVEERIEGLRKKIRTNTEEINESEKKIKTLESEIAALNKVLGASGAEKKKELDAKIIGIKEEINELEANIKSHNNEVKRIKDREAQITKNLLDYDKESEKIKKDVEKYDEEIKELTGQINQLRQSSSNEKEVNYFDLKARVNEIKEALLDKRSDEEELIRKQESFNNYKDYQEELAKKTGLMDKILKKLEQEMSINSELAMKMEQSSNKIDELNRRIEHLKARKNLVIAKRDSGLKQLMDQNIYGIEGTVAQLCKVNEKYELPIRVTAGSRLLNLVVADEDVAKTCIDFLRNNKLGVVTFLPLTKIRAPPQPSGLRTVEGVIDYAINLIDFKDKYGNVFKYIFQNTLVVRDLEVAKKVGIGRIRMVTLTGDLVEVSGAITGGFRGGKTGAKLSSKADEEDLSSAESELKIMKEVFNRLKSSKAENDSNIMSLREKRAALNTEIKNFNMLIEDLNNKSKGFDIRALERLKKEVEVLSEELVLKEAVIQKYEETFNMQDFEKTKSLITEIESKLNSLAINKGIKSSRLKQLTEKDVIELKKIREDLGKQTSEFKKEITDFENKLKNLNTQLKTYEKEEKNFQDKLQVNYKKKDKTEEELNKLKLKIEEKRIHIKDGEEKINDLNLLLAEIKAKIEGLELKYEEYKSLNIKSVNKSVKELEHEIFLLEKRLETFGNVNLKALDVFRIVEEEFNTVKEKMDLLEEENNSIIKTMEEIEGKKIATFMETFKEIQDNFERIFGILSPGGIANLIIEDPQNPLEGGIDIKARPKGKKFLTLKSMSGGEKTLTALSFIFALQEYDPAPFYILDEVDAALDKENATRFGRLCKQYSEKAQFLTISHNDNVISEADYLYGISMTPDGLSKIVTLKLPE